MTDSMLEKFRRRLPLGAQVGYGWLKYRFVPRPIWDDEEFNRYYRWLEKTQWWSRDELKEFQLEQLRALIKHAYENVPYYQRVFDERKLKPEDIVTLDDLQKLPLLYKDDVRENLDDLVARNIDRSSLRYTTTGGSTGKPLGVYQDMPTAYLHELAFIYRQWSWAGYKFGNKIVTLRGSVVSDAGSKGSKAWWDYDPVRNNLILSSFDMTEEKLFQYVQKINEFRPRFIHAFPSSIEILARFMKRNTVNITTIKAIFCESETVYPQQRSFIESQFDCKVFAGYGLTERVADAVECEQHQGYHVNMEYGALELIDRNNEPIKEPGAPGRVVGTGLDTFCMPLIRYVTDDVAEYAPNPCNCGKQSPLIRDFKGRVMEFIVSRTGVLVPLSALNLHSFINDKILEFRYIQEQEGELTIQIAKAPAFSEAEVEKEFLDELYKRLDRNEFSLRIAFVDRVPRTGRGKLGLLYQKLPIKSEYTELIKG